MDISIILDACTSKNMLAFEGAVEISLSLIDTFLEKGETNVDFFYPLEKRLYDFHCIEIIIK